MEQSIFIQNGSTKSYSRGRNPMAISRKSYSTIQKIALVKEIDRMVKDEGEIIQSAAKRVGIPEQNYFRWKKALAPLLAKEEETHAYTPLRTSPSKEIGDLKEELDRAKNKLWEMMLKIDKLEEENQKLREEIARLKGQKQQ